LVWAHAGLFVFFAVTTGAKIYYLGGAYVYLLAAGSVAVERRRGDDWRRWRRLFAWTTLTTVIARGFTTRIGTVTFRCAPD
jgi:hypothetical protein